MQQRSVETRSKILNSATELFSRVGYESASVAEICSAAGVSKGAFFHHFPTKQAVFFGVLEDWLARLDGQIKEVLRSSDNVSDGLLKMTALTPLIFDSEDKRLQIFLEFWNQSCHDPVVWNATIEPYRRYTRMFARLLQSGIQEGSLRPVDAGTASRVLMGLLFGLLLQGMMDPHAADWNVVTREGVKLFMEGLQRRSK